MNPSKELLSEVLGRPITKIQKADNTLLAYWDIYSAQHSLINIYELAFKNLKQWAKLNNVFNIIDWSGEPEEIFVKAEELILIKNGI